MKVLRAKGRGSRGLVFDLRTCEVRATSQECLDLVEVLVKERLLSSLYKNTSNIHIFVGYSLVCFLLYICAIALTFTGIHQRYDSRV